MSKQLVILKFESADGEVFYLKKHQVIFESDAFGKETVIKLTSDISKAKAMPIKKALEISSGLIRCSIIPK